MSDVVWQALIAALLTMYMEWSRRKAATKVAEVAVKADTAAVKVGEVAVKLDSATASAEGKLDHIVQLTNSTLTAAKAALTLSEGRVEQLEKMAGVKPGAVLPERR